MITDTTRLALLVFVEHLGVPMQEVLSESRGAWYERTIERLVAANGDALDALTIHTSDPDRYLIMRAGALVRCLLATEHLDPESP